MMKLKVLLAAALAAAGCAGPSDVGETAAAGPADALYVNAAVWTGNEAAPRAEAIAVDNGRIVYTGDEAGADAYAGEATARIDLGGAFVVPGFIDNHTHFLTGGFSLLSVDLRDAGTPEDFARRIGDYAATLPEGRWIREGNWDHELWGGDLPTKEWIDERTAKNPVFVNRLDGHMALANSAALDLAGVTAETPDPEGGEIVRDADGEPTGVLKDMAMDLVGAVIPSPAQEEWDAAFAAAQAHALERGVTQVHDMGPIGAEAGASFETFRRAKKAGALKLRVYAFTPLAEWKKLQAFVEKNGRGDAQLRWGGLKGFVDGSLGSTTAWFYEPYADAPDKRGFTVTDLDDLAADIKGAYAAGLHVTVHAIGDRSNDWMLDQYADTGGDNADAARFRIEHAQHLTPAAIPRFADLGVIASMQPYHAIDDGRWAEKRIGPDRIKTTYAFRSLLDAGATLTFGSDWPVAPIAPLQGIYAAATRRTIDGANPEGWVREQKITVEEAINAYTIANAYAGFQEEELGTLEAGKRADFVVLSEDITQIDPADIPGVKVLRTVIGGQEVYRAE